MDSTLKELNQKFKGESISFVHKLTSGSSKQTFSFNIKAGGGEIKKYILQTKTDDPNSIIEREYRVLEILKKYSKLPPTPILLEMNPKHLSNPYLIIASVEGNLEFDPINMSDYIQSIASNLSQIHSFPIVQELEGIIPQLHDSISTRINLQNNSKFDDRLNEEEVRLILKKRYQELTSNKPTLLHGDFWPGNIFWLKGKISGIIDWEDAKIGDPLYDVAICRLELAIAFGERVSWEFLNLYKSMNSSLEYVHLPYYELFASLRCMNNLENWAEGWDQFGREDMSVELMYERSRRFIENAINTYYGLYND